MGGLLSALNAGKTSLRTSQKAVEIAGNNIANVNTPGYSRQKAVFQPVPSLELRGFFIGQGVNIDNIAREHDVFLTRQIHDKSSTLGEETARTAPMAELERIFSVAEENLAGEIDKFFDSWKELSTNPSGQTERQVVLQRGDLLARSFNDATVSMRSAQDNINAAIESKVTAVNPVIQEIADLNLRISTVEISGQTANTDRDRRDLLLEDLSKQLGVTYYEEKGQVSVQLPGGMPLISGTQAMSLESYYDTSNNLQLRLDTGASTVDLDLSKVGGEFKGMMQIRDEFIPERRAELDHLAYSLVTQVNAQHQQGSGLSDGVQRVFFDNPSEHFSGGYASDTAQNFGTGTINLSVGTNAPVAINIAAPNNSLTGIAAAINGSGAAVTASVDGGGPADSPYRLMLTSTASPKDSIALDVSGLAGGTYAAPKLETSDGMAKQMEVLLTDTNHVAAGATPGPAAPGDNTNALTMASYGDSLTVMDGTDSYVGYFSKITSKVGIEANRAGLTAKGMEDAMTQLKNMRDATVGVSLEEEMVDLIQYQKGFEASAKFLATVDELMASLLELKR